MDCVSIFSSTAPHTWEFIYWEVSFLGRATVNTIFLILELLFYTWCYMETIQDFCSVSGRMLVETDVRGQRELTSTVSHGHLCLAEC